MDNTVQQIEKLKLDCRNVKSAHFYAFQNKQFLHRTLGICIITINILILSPVLELITLKYTVFFIKGLSIISASLAAIQTFFNYQKEVELHLSAGEAYTSIYRKSGFLLAKYMDKLIKEEDFVKESQELLNEYLSANNNYKMCIPSNNEYDKATESNKKRNNK